MNDVITFNYIETKRLTLREVTPEVYDSLFQSYSDEKLKDFFGFQSDEELAQEKQKHKGGLTTFNRSFNLFHLIEKASGKLIGWCGYHTWYLQHYRAEIGYVLTDESERGKGFMKEAIEPIIQYGFDKMNLHRIEAFVGPQNIPSLKLIRNLGFSEEGVLKEHYYNKSEFEDSVVFSLLKKNYLKQ